LGTAYLPSWKLKLDLFEGQWISTVMHQTFHRILVERVLEAKSVTFFLESSISRTNISYAGVSQALSRLGRVPDFFQRSCPTLRCPKSSIVMKDMAAITWMDSKSTLWGSSLPFRALLPRERHSCFPAHRNRKRCHSFW
jgi:hypothetical protein